MGRPQFCGPPQRCYASDVIEQTAALRGSSMNHNPICFRDMVSHKVSVDSSSLGMRFRSMARSAKYADACVSRTTRQRVREIIEWSGVSSSNAMPTNRRIFWVTTPRRAYD